LKPITKKPRRKKTKKAPAPIAEAFIASSVQGVDVAYAIQENFEDDEGVNVTVWRQGVFAPSRDTIDQLLAALDVSDFGIFVFTPDDVTKINGKTQLAVRDNVILELGLFMGKLGPPRCFMVVPKEARNVRIPTDLKGLTYLTYKSSRDNINAALGAACNGIRKVVKELGVFRESSGALLKRPAPLTKGKISVRTLPKWVLSRPRPLI
jgi:predicted nucleotide-binding protein